MKPPEKNWDTYLHIFQWKFPGVIPKIPETSRKHPEVLAALLEALEELRADLASEGLGGLVDGRQPAQAALEACS